MPRKLRDIDISEISLVDEAANKKKFYIVKRRRTMLKEFVEILKSWFGEELTDEAIAKAKELSEEAAKAIKGALATLDKFVEDLPDDAVAAIKTLGKYASYGYPAKKSAGEEEVTIEKMGARLSKVTLEEIKKIREFIVQALGEAGALKKAKELIEGLIGEATVEKKDGEPGLPKEVQDQLAELKKYKDKERQELELAKQKEEKELKDKIKKLEEEVEVLKKSKGLKKSLDGQDDGEGEGGDKELWPSIHIGPIEEK